MYPYGNSLGCKKWQESQRTGITFLLSRSTRPELCPNHSSCSRPRYIGSCRGHVSFRLDRPNILNNLLERSSYRSSPLQSLSLKSVPATFASARRLRPYLAHFKLGFPLPATCGPENYGLFPFLLYFLGLPRFRVSVSNSNPAEGATYH